MQHRDEKFEMKSLFISHTHSDKSFVRKLADDLIDFNIDVWIDEAEIKIGDSLIDKIREGIDKVDFLAVILSPESVESEWVKREVDIAMNQEIRGKKIKVLPLMYKKCDLPWFLEGKYFGDFTNPEYYNSAFNALLTKLGYENSNYLKAKSEFKKYENALMDLIRDLSQLEKIFNNDFSLKSNFKIRKNHLIKFYNNISKTEISRTPSGWKLKIEKFDSLIVFPKLTNQAHKQFRMLCLELVELVEKTKNVVYQELQKSNSTIETMEKLMDLINQFEDRIHSCFFTAEILMSTASSKVTELYYAQSE